MNDYSIRYFCGHCEALYDAKSTSASCPYGHGIMNIVMAPPAERRSVARDTLRYLIALFRRLILGRCTTCDRTLPAFPLYHADQPQKGFCSEMCRRIYWCEYV